MTSDPEQYHQLLTELIQTQMVILGPSTGLDVPQHVSGLEIDSSGKVEKLLANPQLILNELSGLYTEISPHTTKKTLQTLLTQYPDIQKPVL